MPCLTFPPKSFHRLLKWKTSNISRNRIGTAVQFDLLSESCTGSCYVSIVFPKLVFIFPTGCRCCSEPIFQMSRAEIPFSEAIYIENRFCLLRSALFALDLVTFLLTRFFAGIVRFGRAHCCRAVIPSYV